MATPTTQQAHRYRADQAESAAAGAASIAGLVATGAPWPQVLATFEAYQFAGALLAMAEMAEWLDLADLGNPEAFVGVSSLGFPALEPLIATIDRVVPAPARALPEPWWDDVSGFIESIEQLLESEIQDAARSAAQVEMVAAGRGVNWVRLLQPPSCKRCVQLAGRVYRELEGFDRHPGCDCVHRPVDSAEQALADGLVIDGREAVEKGWVRDLSQADTQAILDGADISQVVNATSGTSQPGITSAVRAQAFGRSVKATTFGTTKRARWRQRNPSTLVRLRPESIYAIVEREYGGDREQARRLLRRYGYL